MATAISDFAKYVRLEVPGCPEPIILDAILRICIDFCTRTELLSEIINVTLVAATSTYTITPTDATTYPARLRSLVPSTLIPLDPIDAASYAVMQERTQSGTPMYFFAPTRTQVTLAPIPDAAATLTADIVLRPTRDATTVATVLYDEWATTIAAGAKSELMLMLGMPWANADLGGLYAARYANDVDAASVEVGMGNVGGAMHIAVNPI